MPNNECSDYSSSIVTFVSADEEEEEPASNAKAQKTKATRGKAAKPAQAKKKTVVEKEPQGQ